MPTEVPYNTGKVLIGSNLPLPEKHYTMSDDALKLQKALLPPTGRVIPIFNPLSLFRNFPKGNS